MAETLKFCYLYICLKQNFKQNISFNTRGLDSATEKMYCNVINAPVRGCTDSGLIVAVYQLGAAT